MCSWANFEKSGAGFDLRSRRKRAIVAFEFGTVAVNCCFNVDCNDGAGFECITVQRLNEDA